MRPINVANAVKNVAPPSHAANEVSQQQLVPSVNAKMLPNKDFL